jgi:polysaccharide pyruvyl transferase WcaK-like protein
VTAVAEARILDTVADNIPSTSTRAPRIGVIYPSGWGNLGDEAILQSTFAALRRRWPDVAIRAFTLHPVRTASNHGVEADFLTGVSRPMFLSARPDEPAPVRMARAMARRSRRIPLLGHLADAAANITAAIVYEASAASRAWTWLQSADLVLAAGGGQLDAAWGGAWGQPYALARWVWMARRARVPFAFLSVGYGQAPDWLSRRLIRYAVQNADYCSLRDAGSRTLTQNLGVDRELPVVPDLAFALPSGVPARANRPGHDIGISPMVFLKPGAWPHEDAAKYERMLQLWADLITALVERGDRAHLFVSDPGDMDAVRDVQARLGEPVRAVCSIAEASNPDALLEFFRGLDLVVSSRLHGVLLAIVANRPVLALAHERKVRAVMSDAGVASYCTELSLTSIGEVEQKMNHLLAESEECTERLRDYVKRASRTIRKQEELLPRLLRKGR